MGDIHDTGTDNDPLETMITYRLASGDLIYGQYGWVTDSDYFDDVDWPLEVVRETWQRMDSEPVTFEPPGWKADDDE